MYQLQITGILRKIDGALIPLDAGNTDYVQYLKWLDEGNTPDPIPKPFVSQAEAIASLLNAYKRPVQAYLDRAAQAKGYDDIKSAALRCAFDGPYKAEGQAFAVFMDTVWARCYELQAEVMAGQRQLFTPSQLLDMLPTLNSQTLQLVQPGPMGDKTYPADPYFAELALAAGFTSATAPGVIPVSDAVQQAADAALAVALAEQTQ